MGLFFKPLSEAQQRQQSGLHGVRFANRIKASLETVSSEPVTYTNKHGTTAAMNTANIGKAKGLAVVESDSMPHHRAHLFTVKRYVLAKSVVTDDQLPKALVPSV
jgi:hypothetical protein